MIRKATACDCEKITEIFAETKTPWSLKSVISSVEKDIVMVFDDGEVKGVIAVSKVLDECEILNFAVKSNCRGQGIGEKLINSIFEQGNNYFLDVRESNYPAISLYKKVGFEQINIRKNFYENPAENAIIMKKSV